MTNWIIIQSLKSYSEHPDWVGCGLKEDEKTPIHRQFASIKKGDKIAYYATGDKVIVGVFEVLSDRMEIVHGDRYWDDPIGIYRLKPSKMPFSGHYLDFKRLLFSRGIAFDLFPDKNGWTYLIWNHYIHKLSDHDLRVLGDNISDERFLVTAAQAEGKPPAPERLGTAVENVGLLFDPIDEMGVVYLFASHHRKLGFPFVIRLRDKFPDATVVDSKGETRKVELEFKASNFVTHKHPLNGCDFIVCWENDWEDAPKDAPKIIPLKEALSDIFTPRS